MMKRGFFHAAGCLIPSLLMADAFDPPAGYYAAAFGKTGSALESALHNIIDSHTVIPYSWPPYQDLDEAPGDAGSVTLIYSGITRSKSDNGGNVGDWNREHLWPKSFGVGSDGADTSDIFNLRPADVQVNSERGSLYFDNTDPAGAQALQFYAPGSSKDSDSWEPRDVEKGDIARSCFYMAVRYDGSDFATSDLKLSDTPNKSNSEFGRLLTLLQWHREDPVSEAERERNQRIYDDYQRNRNPFIDHPEFAELLFLESYPAMDSDADGIIDFWEWANAGNAEGDAGTDDDDDGIPLLAEFAMLGDPQVADAEKSPRLFRSGSNYLFEYRKNRAAVNLDFIVEESDTMGESDWDPVSDFSESTVTLNPDLDRVTLTIPDDSEKTRRFFRLRLEVTP